MNVQKLLFTAALVAATPAMDVHAQDSSWYLGAKVGAASTDDRWIDDSDSSYGVLVGYRFNQALALEAEYTDFGDLRVDLDDLDIRSTRLEPRSWGLKVLGTLPITARIDLLGSVGYHSFDMDPRDEDGFRDVIGSRRSTDLFYGVGAQFNFESRLSLRAQVQRYEFRRSGDSDEASLSLMYNF